MERIAKMERDGQLYQIGPKIDTLMIMAKTYIFTILQRI